MPKGCVAMLAGVVGLSGRKLPGNIIILWNPLGSAISRDYSVRQVCYDSKDRFPGILLSIDLETYDHDINFCVESSTFVTISQCYFFHQQA